MWLYNQTSKTAGTALIYTTVGALTVIWAGVWFVALFNNPPESSAVYYWCTGFIVTGLTLVLIGLGVGRMGQPTQVTAVAPEVPIAVMTPQPAAPIAPTPAPPVDAANSNGTVVVAEGTAGGTPLQRG